MLLDLYRTDVKEPPVMWNPATKKQLSGQFTNLMASL